MDENRASILIESGKTISKLQLIAVFFEDELIYKIYLRTGVIHQLFEGNASLDINKLEIFHVQFTDSVMALLKKVKLNNEKNMELLFDEIQLNKDIIRKMGDSPFTEANFNNDKQRQAVKINQSLRQIYQVLSDYSPQYPLAKNLNAFSARFAQDFYFDISPDLFNELISYDPQQVYRNEYISIHRKLMGLLCKLDFRSEFVYGLKAGMQTAEVYKLTGDDRYFLYYPAGNLFLFMDMAKMKDNQPTDGASKKEKLIYELTDKNNRLEGKIAALKSQVPADIKNLLGEYYKKISELDFLQLSNADIQANVLKTMLNTDSI